MKISPSTLTWWGCAGIELDINGRVLVVDPMVNPSEPRVHYICISHNDFDHCHEPTLEKLTTGTTFERLIVPPSCPVKSKLDSPIPPIPGASKDLAYVRADKLTVMYPKYKRERGKAYPGPSELELDGFRIETVDSSERPQRYKAHPDDMWPAGTGPYVGDGEYPNLGYLITERSTGLTFYHPGDLGQVFDSHRQLRGRVDFIFFPIPKLQGQEITLIDALRPKYLIPMHYRVATPDFPIPIHISQGELTMLDISMGLPKPGADPTIYSRESNALMAAHAYPTTPPPPLDRILSLAPALRAVGTEVVVLEAGRAYALSDLVRSGHA